MMDPGDTVFHALIRARELMELYGWRYEYKVMSTRRTHKKRVGPRRQRVVYVLRPPIRITIRSRK